MEHVARPLLICTLRPNWAKFNEATCRVCPDYGGCMSMLTVENVMDYFKKYIIASIFVHVGIPAIEGILFNMSLYTYRSFGAWIDRMELDTTGGLENE